VQRSLTLALGLGAAALWSAASAPAQGTLWTRYGDTTYDVLGWSVSDFEDINGDGIPEVLAGGPWDDTGANEGGHARVLDGATGSVIVTFYGSSTNDDVGAAVSKIGDITGDGISEFAYCALLGDLNANGGGEVFVHNGLTFQQLYVIGGNTDWDQFGVEISDCGDVNGDGWPDFIVGADQDGGNLGSSGTGRGYARVIDGPTGNTIWEVQGANNDDFFGRGVSGIGDVNGDGFDDFLVGAQGADNNGAGSGSVYLFDGATGTLIFRVDGESNSTNLGRKVSEAGDVNGDGIPDFVSGMHNRDVNANNAGGVVVFSGADGSELWKWYGDQDGQQLGWSVAGGRDLTGDGVPDIVAGAPYRDSPNGTVNHGAVFLFDGATGAQVWELLGNLEHAVFGYSVAVSADMSGDGIDEAIGGGIMYDPQGDGNGLVMAIDPTGTPPPPPIQWPNLPSTFVAVGAGYFDDFEAHAGVVPSHMAVNELNALTRQFEPDAFCNIGQKMPCTGGNSNTFPYSGAYDLEMGNFPGSISGVVSANGLVIGLDGTGSGDLFLSFQVYDFGEESNPDDGVFVSEDGLTWIPVYTDWAGLTNFAWTELTDLPLSTLGVNTDGPFYLLFAQSDNFPIGEGDGVLIDDITVAPAATGPVLSITPGVAGTVNTLQVDNGTPQGMFYFIYGFAPGSVAVPGCQGLTADINNPQIAGNDLSDNAGVASISVPVPASASGVTVQLQAVNITHCEKTDVLVHTFP